MLDRLAPLAHLLRMLVEPALHRLENALMFPSGDCPRRSSLPRIQETACFARDPTPQRSASSGPPANRAGIIPPESFEAGRFHTAWVSRDRPTAHENPPMSAIP